MMQTPKVRGTSPETALKVSPRPRAARQLKPTVDSHSPNSSSNSSRTPKERSVAVAERRSSRGSATELLKKSPSKVSQLESQIVELQLKLSQAKEQLNSSETLKQQALEDADEFRKQVSALTLELEESKQKFQELAALEEARSIDVQNNFEKREQEWQSKFDTLQVHHAADFAALGSAMEEIQRLKSQLETVAETPRSQTEKTEEAAVADTRLLEENPETFSLLEDMKTELKACKDSEARAHALANETLLQLETARAAVETLQSEGTRSSEAYNSLASQLNESKERTKALEELVRKLKADLSNNSGKENRMAEDEVESLKERLRCLKSELDVLKSAQETAEVEEQIRTTVQEYSASELVEHIKSETTHRETELELEVTALKSHAAELKASMMDKESELRCISEENEQLNKKLQTALSGQKELQLEKEMNDLKETIAELKANLMDKETEFQNITEENETLKSELRNKEMDIGKTNDTTLSELNAAKTAEREALRMLESVKEEADRSSKRATRVAEQLGAAQAANAEMEVELRKIKVQSDQWRKAAEVAASMLSDGSPGNVNESLEGKSSPLANRKNGSPYTEDLDEDPLKRRNNNVLKKFGLSWKKSQK